MSKASDSAAWRGGLCRQGGCVLLSWLATGDVAVTAA